MRPVGSGSTSDMEVRMYMDSLPSIIGSPEGRAFTASVFQSKANIERAVMDANRKWRNKEIDVGEWIEINERLRSQSMFTTATERKEIERLVPDFSQEWQTLRLITAKAQDQALEGYNNGIYS